MKIKEWINSIPIWMWELCLLITVIIGAVWVLYTFNKVCSENEQISNHADSLINTPIVLNSDTLIIVDYSIWNDEYTLSNGVVVDSKVVDADVIK